MKLQKIEIKNFRSIKEESIELKHNCLVFVGKNEAGKSNLLKAIAGGLSQKTIAFKDSDKRNLLDDEDYENQKYFIDYTFRFTEEEIKKVLNGTNSFVKIVNYQGKKFTLFEFFSEFFSKGVYRYDFEKKVPQYLHFVINDAEILNVGQVKVAFTQNGKDYSVNSWVNFDEIEEANQKNCEKISDIQKIISDCHGKMEQIIKSSLPPVYYWKYSDTLLIPDRFPLQTFIDNPSSCKPLKNIFDLAGIENIARAFQDNMKKCGDYDNLLDRVSRRITEKIKKTWPDLKKIKIILSENSQEIRIKIQEKIRQNVSARSDGFKKFVSILCMLASPVSTGKIKNSLIILDEPDDGLYPTGAGYLRDMLIDMAETNVVFYSTHNPCMIDKAFVDRHIIVEKNDDITTLKKDLTDSNFRDDEVLLRAIGMSAFENIRETNILFEGWTDYRVFNTALSSNLDGFKNVLKSLIESGSSYGTGTNSLKNIISMIKLLDKKTFIVLDADKEGQEKKRTLQKDFPEEKVYTLDDLGDYNGFTLEDFIKDELIQQALDSINSDKKIKDKGDKKVMQFLACLNKDDKQNFKAFLGKHIQSSNIKKEYFAMLKTLKERMETDNAK